MADANRQSAGTIWLPTGNPDTTNISSTDFLSLGGQPGGLGIRFQASPATNAYQRVKLDSGATSATSVGIVAANQLAYWKDKSQYIVTNDSAQAIGGSGQGTSSFRNFVAGIFRSAVTAGNYCDVLQAGQNISVKTTGTVAIGDTIVADTSATTAQGVAVTSGTAPTCQPLGTARAAATANVTPVDVNIQMLQ